MILNNATLMISPFEKSPKLLLRGGVIIYSHRDNTGDESFYDLDMINSTPMDVHISYK